MVKVEFHFDFGSPNAYLAHRVIPEIERRTGAKFDYVPVLLGEWLESGVHVTSIVGSNKELLAEGLVSRPRRELDDHVLAKAQVIVATLKQQGIQDEQGDFIEPIQNGVIKWDNVRELADLVAGKVTGRTSKSQITLFKQNSDQGVGFMALARLIHDKARKAGIGIEI